MRMLRVACVLFGSFLATSAIEGCFSIGYDGKCFDFHPSSEEHCSGDRNIVAVTTSCSEDRGVEEHFTIVKVCGTDEICSSPPSSGNACIPRCIAEGDCAPSSGDAGTSNVDVDGGVDGSDGDAGADAEPLATVPTGD